MSAEREAQLPEFLGPRRDRYHYYNEWMRRRIRYTLLPLMGHGGGSSGGDDGSSSGGAAHYCGGRLPPAVEAKLLTLPADDLDLMLQHPLAAAAQVCTRWLAAETEKSLISSD